MPAQLVALTEGPSILLDKPIMLFGRNPECDIQIDSRKVSRRHCCVAQVSDYLVVRDLGSTNGVRINGVRLLEGRLRHGDELTIGSHRYQVRWDGQELPAAARNAVVPEPAHMHGTVPEGEDDEHLEECDEPVALPEPGAPRPVLPGGTTAMAAEKDSRPSKPVLPENLDLAPSSQVLRTERDG